MSDINMIVLRPTVLQGQRLDVGTSVAVDALTAAALRDSGKAQLKNPNDAEAVEAAVRADAVKATGRVGIGRHWPPK